MKILLHTCCGPCAIHPVDFLRAGGMEVYSYFYNPNIHPYTEFVKRKETLEQYAAGAGLKTIIDDDYDLEGFIRKVVYREAQRCRICYALRLERAAGVARKGGFDYFTTTLLVSPFQKHDLIHETGRAAGERYGVPFYYADFRPGYREAAARSRELNLYRQQYCGCIYSEKERYCRKPSKAKPAKSGSRPNPRGPQKEEP